MKAKPTGCYMFLHVIQRHKDTDNKYTEKLKTVNCEDFGKEGVESYDARTSL